MSDKIQVYTFCFNDYDKNKCIKACIDSWSKCMPYADIHILRDDYIKNVPEKYQTAHYRFCRDNNLFNTFIADSVRVSFTNDGKRYLYLDVDTFIIHPVPESFFDTLSTGCTNWGDAASTSNMWYDGKLNLFKPLIDFYDNFNWTLQNYNNFYDGKVMNTVYKGDFSSFTAIQTSEIFYHITFGWFLEKIKAHDKFRVVKTKDELMNHTDTEVMYLYFKEPLWNKDMANHQAAFHPYFKKFVLEDLKKYKPNAVIEGI